MRLPEEGLWGDHRSLPLAHYPQTSSLFTPEAPPGTKSQTLGGLRAQYSLAENHMEWPPKVTHPEWQSWRDQPSWSAPAGTEGLSGMRDFQSLKGDSPRQCGVLGLAPGNPNFSSPSTPQMGEEKRSRTKIQSPQAPGGLPWVSSLPLSSAAAAELGSGTCAPRWGSGGRAGRGDPRPHKEAGPRQF